MSAAEDDTELRDLLIQNLETNGVLNKIKAELRAAVFLAMEEQDTVENKTPLINHNLKKCLSTKEGRLVASLILDFLQVFNLDFTMAVFQPEIDLLSGLDGRDVVCRSLGLSASELNHNTPVLLELVRRGSRRVSISSEVFQDKEVSHTPQESTTPPPVSKDVVSDKTQLLNDNRAPSPGLRKEHLDLDMDEDLDDGDSFFDDPLPKPQKTYGWRAEPSGSRESPAGSQSEDAPPSAGAPPVSEHSHNRNDSRPKREGARGGVKEQSKLQKDKNGSLCLDEDVDVEYDDDFNSHRSDLSKSSFSIGEEIEEVSIEGPESSDQLDDSTRDVSISQLTHSRDADYMEDVT
ncbi:centrosomal protein 43 isoform X2 [Cynoglossus semilaevis]|uniref:centrosomal protein 43 isoform X2 n=1 Tax=Cynoglossus semilaevis TaxID=244447 RepID=UPI0004978258|nr:FGFR1 oncogene partner isoform X2 [Cynoglossus semilaevis]